MDILDSLDSSFSASYGQAREKFLAACSAHGITPGAYENPQSGPAGEVLATDVAWFGPQDARACSVKPSVTPVLARSSGNGIESTCT